MVNGVSSKHLLDDNNSPVLSSKKQKKTEEFSPKEILDYLQSNGTINVEKSN
jgi:hypothetical protein